MTEIITHPILFETKRGRVPVDHLATLEDVAEVDAAVKHTDKAVETVRTAMLNNLHAVNMNIYRTNDRAERLEFWLVINWLITMALAITVVYMR